MTTKHLVLRYNLQLTEDHILQVCSDIQKCTNIDHLNSELSEVIFTALNRVKDQTKVQEKTEELQEFFTQNAKSVFKNDLVRIMADQDPTKEIDLQVVSKCFSQLGKSLLEIEEVQSLIDSFTHRCIKALLKEVSWQGNLYFLY